MSTNPRRIRAQLAVSSGVLDSLSRRMPAAVGAARIAIDAGPETPAREGGRRKGWVVDPTGERATSRVDASDAILGDLEQQIDTLLLTLALLSRFADQWAPILGDRTRCHGGRTVDAWSDPGCTAWADTWLRADGTESVRADGLCMACRKRKERWERARVA